MRDVISRVEARAAGVKRYFTGLPCTRGHVVERDVAQGKCLECERLRHATYNAEKALDPAWRAAEVQRALAYNRAHPEIKNANNRLSRARHPDSVAGANQRWYQSNRDKALADNRRWQQTHPGKMREYDKRRREKNPEKTAARLLALITNPGYRDAARHNRRSKISAGGDKVSAAEMTGIKARAKGCCANCGEPSKLEFDHIVPIARGGKHVARNLQMLCRPCNQAKRARDPLEWAQANGRLL